MAGVVTAIAGAAVIAGAPEPCRPKPGPYGELACGPENLVVLPVTLVAFVLGGALITVGGGLAVTGLVSLPGDRAEAPAPVARPVTAPAEAAPAPAAPAPAVAIAAAVRSDLSASRPGALDAAIVRLTLEARAGHCASATLIARAVVARDPRPVLALVERDADVARCLAYRM